ncbi:MAG: DNA alkylation repair protein [Acidobacteriota bacterium]|nr:DNA alkylation repair protein [Acidobacteriota bacterium]
MGVFDVPRVVIAASQARRRLREFADPARAIFVSGFFKTGPGQYGEGDQFLGLNVPDLRKIAREFRSLPLADLRELLQSKWHEERLLALVILVDQYDRGDAKEREAIYKLYLASTSRINNWDLVDCSAPRIVGGQLEQRSRKPLYRLVKSKSVWERRIALLATLHFIRKGEFDDTFALTESLLGDKHDLIHKAAGWMLREIGKRNRAALENFLRKHAAKMPRTMLRYAIERFSPAVRRRYLKR